MKVESAAIASHFLQNTRGDIPLLNNNTRRKLHQLLTSKENREDGIYACEGCEELPNIEIADLFNELPYPPPKKWDFTFIDLFAGIGGFRQAFQAAGGKCVFSSEWNKYAQKTYAANYGEIPYGDIRAIPKEQIPTHDVLCAGFPCQPFSLAGVSKKNSLGRKHGFEDETQGTLFFEIKEILRLKRPKAFMLENVKNLLSHDKGRTFEVIRKSLVDELGYVIGYKVVNGAAWVPQHRERIYILGFDPQQINISPNDIIVPDRPELDYKYPKLSSIIKPALRQKSRGMTD
ncbi:MAG: DNA (cytosine-5-)-methyltransferase [Akkermansiaceae bacterium]|nr:DNA (cytosine-5-)-methyltransferase [Akkermansiaceae bacterium]